MQKQYSPIQIINPVSQNHLVRLRVGQKLHLVFNKPDFVDCHVDISGNFLKLENIELESNGKTISLYQVEKYSLITNVTFFLGEVSVLCNNSLVSSFCVVSESINADYFRAIQPENNFFRLEPHQILDVFFYSKNYSELWGCSIIEGKLHLEQIDHSIRPLPIDCAPSYLTERYLVEERFQFRLNSKSIELIQNLPHGRYDGGNLAFFKNKNFERANLNIVYNWKGKKSQFYKALLLPKKNPGNFYKKPKQAMFSNVNLKKIESDDIAEGCNVIFAKCR